VLLEPATVTVTLPPFLSYAPLIIADAEGFFAEQAIEVEFLRVNNAPELLPSLVQGDLDVFAGALAPGFLNLVSGGERVRIVADKGHLPPDSCTYFAVMARPEVVAS